MGNGAHNQGMNERKGDRKAPRDGGTSWADETLPLGLRKELLARELQKVAASKARPQSASPQSALTGRKVEGQTRERTR